MKSMQNILTFPAFNEGQSTWLIFKGISPNHTKGCNLFKTKTFHKSNENLYAAQSGHSCSQLDVCGSVHHSTIHYEKSNKMQQCIKI